jgi:hypothetical protein
VAGTPGSAGAHLAESIAPKSHRSTGPPPPGTGGESASLSAKNPTHDVWQALPARAADALEEVTKRPRPTATVAAAIKLSPRRTLEILKALEPVGLVTRMRRQVPGGRPPALWTRSPMTLDEAAIRLGVAAASRARRKKLRLQHGEERARFDEALRGPQPRMALPR